MKPSADELNGSTSKVAQIVEQQPGDLKPWPGNPRTHSDKQLTKLKASIQTFGFTAPVLVDEAGVILSGHGRVQAAKELGLPQIPTRVLAGLSEAKKRAYVIADNKIAQLSGWDQPLLKSELEILIREEFEVETIGFTTAEIDLMFDTEAPAGSDPDDLQEEDVHAEVVTRAGDLWQLGQHRLHCGDALRPESCHTLMREERAPPRSSSR
jgi:ParB-like chromosome segregation protein Spo0J